MIVQGALTSGAPCIGEMMQSNNLSLHLPPEILRQFLQLFGQGVGIKTTTGITLEQLLCGPLGFSKDYVDNRVQTVFVNGRAVDQVDRVFIHDDTVIALSAAMPGLAGATLRKGGHLAGMRHEISQRVEASCDEQHEGMVTLKLFNIVAREMGPQVLQKGVWVTSKAWRGLLKTLTLDQLSAETRLVWNGKQINADQFREFAWPDEWISLTITASGAGI